MLVSFCVVARMKATMNRIKVRALANSFLDKAMGRPNLGLPLLSISRWTNASSVSSCVCTRVCKEDMCVEVHVCVCVCVHKYIYKCHCTLVSDNGQISMEHVHVYMHHSM